MEPETKVAVQGFSRWHIDTHITCNTTGAKWRLTGFYGQPDTSKREETWSISESLYRTNQLPWLCIRDYNKIISQSEKSGGRLWPSRHLDWFCRAISLCGFHNLGFVASPFTWSKTGHIKGRLKIRLDKALANNAWWLLFHGAVVHHISMSTSDHSMLSLHLKSNCHHQRPVKKLFWFEEIWLRDPHCSEVV